MKRPLQMIGIISVLMMGIGFYYGPIFSGNYDINAQWILSATAAGVGLGIFLLVVGMLSSKEMR